MMSLTIETFTDFCPKCDKKIAPNASFCHFCGHCLIVKEPSTKAKNRAALDLEGIKALFESTTNLFLLWLLEFSFFVVSGIFYKLYHLSSLIIITGVLFFYTWIFLTSKLDELAGQFDRKQSLYVYLRLLIPVVGTIISYYKVSKLAKTALAK